MSSSPTADLEFAERKSGTMWLLISWEVALQGLWYSGIQTLTGFHCSERNGHSQDALLTPSTDKFAPPELLFSALSNWRPLSMQ
jgi:hypothetical protein